MILHYSVLSLPAPTHHEVIMSLKVLRPTIIDVENHHFLASFNASFAFPIDHLCLSKSSIQAWVLLILYYIGNKKRGVIIPYILPLIWRFISLPSKLLHNYYCFPSIFTLTKQLSMMLLPRLKCYYLFNVKYFLNWFKNTNGWILKNDIIHFEFKSFYF